VSTLAVPEPFEPILLRIVGDPQPEGNKRPLRNFKTGGIVLVEGRTPEATQKARTWREAVAWTTRQWMAANGHPGPIVGPVRVDALFLLPKPPSRPKRERLALTGFDVDKLTRSLGDALSKDAQLIADDKRVISWSVAKLWAVDTSPGAVIRIEPLEQTDWADCPLTDMVWP
jgi:Holliday junction resolvase RusA-like endonuclease